jgi:serine/threonine-protein kinase
MLEIKKGTEIQGRYVVGDQLGIGGFAIVWRATDKQLGRDVAIKRLTSIGGKNQHVIDEARRTVKLGGHQNIVQVFDVIQQGDEALLVMEFVDGESLEAICRRHIVNKTWLDQ